MKSRIFSIFLVFFFLTGCSHGQSGQGTAFTGFQDALGREVTVQEPKRVACLLGSFAQVWQLAGGEVIATADDAWDDLGLELPEEIK